LDRDHLGGFQQGPPESCPDGSGSAGDNIVDEAPSPNATGIWATPAMWPGDGGSIYVPYPTIDNPGKLASYKIVDSNGQPTFSLAGQSDGTFGFGSSSAIVSSDGTTSGSGLVWIVFLPDGSGVNAELRAYDPNPVDGVLQMRGSWPIGTGNKFTTPTISAGRIYVGTADGNVHAFGATSQSAQANRPSRSTAKAVPATPDREG
jgi:iron transport multicopper oxidase